MHCVTLAELAALISQHGPDLIASQTAIRAGSVSCYWVSSRKRLEIWNGALCELRAAQRLGHSATVRQWWDRNQPLLEDIVVSELLTRVFAALTAEIETVTHRDEVSPVTHAIYLAHMEASNRVYRLIVLREGQSIQNAVQLNRLRQGVQRWTDAMIGRLAIDPTVALGYAFDYERARAFADESRDNGELAYRRISTWLSNASMRDTLSRRTSSEITFPAANADIADAIMLMLQSELFDDLGTIQSGWRHRITNGVTPTECAAVDKETHLPNWSDQSQNAAEM
jgi:hypothetical protein